MFFQPLQVGKFPQIPSACPLSLNPWNSWFPSGNIKKPRFSCHLEHKMQDHPLQATVAPVSRPHRIPSVVPTTKNRSPYHGDSKPLAPRDISVGTSQRVFIARFLWCIWTRNHKDPPLLTYGHEHIPIPYRDMYKETLGENSNAGCKRGLFWRLKCF